jgi:DNA-binding MarR family transcriptional regulator
MKFIVLLKHQFRLSRLFHGKFSISLDTIHAFRNLTFSFLNGERMRKPQPDSPDFAFLITHAARVIDHRIRLAMDAYGVPKGQGMILSLLSEHGALSQGEIARILHITPASVTGMVQPLERDGLVERRSTPGDDRVLSVSLTEHGEQMAVNIHEVLNHVEKEVCTLIPEALRSPLRASLQIILQTWGRSPCCHPETVSQERK